MPDRHPLHIGWLHQLSAEPWKNGGGVTRTLAQGGHDAAGVAGWRVSLADIVQNGPYSSFAGQTRHSLILAGQGVDLADAQTRLALRPQQAHAADDGDQQQCRTDQPGQGGRHGWCSGRNAS